MNKQVVRDYLALRAKSNVPPPSIEEIRKMVGYVPLKGKS